MSKKIIVLLLIQIFGIIPALGMGLVNSAATFVTENWEGIKQIGSGVGAVGAYATKKYFSEANQEGLDSNTAEATQTSNPSFSSLDYLLTENILQKEKESMSVDERDGFVSYQNQDVPKAKPKPIINRPSGSSKHNDSDSDEEKQEEEKDRLLFPDEEGQTVGRLAKKGAGIGIYGASKAGQLLKKEEKAVSSATKSAAKSVAQDANQAFIESTRVMNKIKKLPHTKKLLRELKKHLDGKLLDLEGNPIAIDFEHFAHGNITPQGGLAGMHFIPQDKNPKKVPIFIEKINNSKFDNLPGGAQAGIIHFKLSNNKSKSVKPMSCFFDPGKTAKQHAQDIIEAWQDARYKIKMKDAGVSFIREDLINTAVGISSSGAKITFKTIDLKKKTMDSIYPALSGMLPLALGGALSEEAQASGNGQQFYEPELHQEQYYEEKYYEPEKGGYASATESDYASQESDVEDYSQGSDIEEKQEKQLADSKDEQEEMLPSGVFGKSEEELSQAHNPFKYDYIASNLKPVETSNIYRTKEGFEYNAKTAGRFGVSVHAGPQREAIASLNHALYAPIRVGGNFVVEAQTGPRILEISHKQDLPLIKQKLQECSIEEFSALAFKLQESKIGQERFNELLKNCTLEQYGQMSYNLQTKPLALLKLAQLVQHATSAEINNLPKHVREFEAVKARRLKLAEEKAMAPVINILSGVCAGFEQERVKFQQKRKKEKEKAAQEYIVAEAVCPPGATLKSMKAQVCQEESQENSQEVSQLAQSLNQKLEIQEAVEQRKAARAQRRALRLEAKRKKEAQKQALLEPIKQDLERARHIQAQEDNNLSYDNLYTYEQKAVDHMLEAQYSDELWQNLRSHEKELLVYLAVCDYVQKNPRSSQDFYNPNGFKVTFTDLPYQEKDAVDMLIKNQIGEEAYQSLNHTQWYEARDAMTQQWLAQPGVYQRYLDYYAKDEAIWAFIRFQWQVQSAISRLRNLRQELEQAQRLHAPEPEAQRLLAEFSAFNQLAERIKHLEQGAEPANNLERQLLERQKVHDKTLTIVLGKGILRLDKARSAYINAQKAKEGSNCIVA